MMRRSLVVLLVSCAACSGTDDGSLDIDGTVRSVTDNAPLVDASLTLSWHTSPFESASFVAHATDGGHYVIRLSAVPCNNITLTAAAAGFKSFTTGVECTREPQQLDFSLAPN